MRFNGAVASLCIALLPLSAAAGQARANAGYDAVSGDVARCEAWIATRHSGDDPVAHLIGRDTMCVDTNTVGLTEELAKSFAEKIALIPKNHTPRIVIRSLGGDVRYGISMGEAVLARKAMVFVSTFCASSCANYIFLPAERRSILKDGVVLFHGGINLAVIDDWVEAQSGAGADRRQKSEVRKRIQADLRRQNALLSQAGVDPRFFEWMDALNRNPENIERQCAGRGKVSMIVFSDSFLKSRGVVIDMNEGPLSQGDVDRILERYGFAANTCFWS